MQTGFSILAYQYFECTRITQ